MTDRAEAHARATARLLGDPVDTLTTPPARRIFGLSVSQRGPSKRVRGRAGLRCGNPRKGEPSEPGAPHGPFVGDNMTECKLCGATIPPAKRNRRSHFCSDECSRAYPKLHYPTLAKTTDISSGTIGAIGELRVCSDLLALGFHVYRAQSPSCPCDLVVMDRYGHCTRVEVTTARRGPTGKIYHANKRATSPYFDALALVFSDGTIEYNPQLRQNAPETTISASPLSGHPNDK